MLRIFVTIFAAFLLMPPANAEEASMWGQDNLRAQVPEREATLSLARKILKLNPAVPKPRAWRIAWLVLHQSPLPLVSVAILFQESGFRDVHSATDDLGIAQVNRATAESLGCDIPALETHDLAEGISCHVRILKMKLEVCKSLGDAAFSCYHSTTPELRAKYYRAVRAHLQEIQDAE